MNEEYKNIIKKHFSCVKFTSNIYEILQKESDLLVKKLLKTQDIFYLLVEKSMELRIEVPSYTQITTIISSSINAQNTLVYKKIRKYENHEALKNLDYLLKEDVSNPTKYVLGAKIGVTWTLVSEILGHQNHFYLDTKIGRHLDTFLDTPMKKIILS